MSDTPKPGLRATLLAWRGWSQYPGTHEHLPALICDVVQAALRSPDCVEEVNALAAKYDLSK